MQNRILSMLIGYLFGSFLTAELVAMTWSGKRAAEVGDTGNPGMANIMSALGFIPGIITLAGDLSKCILAQLLSCALFRQTGWIVTMYAGLGCTLGHDFPFWRRFRGGKGVATTSIAISVYAFIPGLAANIAGMLCVFATKYLCIGGPIIPLSFTFFMLVHRDFEAAALAAVLTLLSLSAHLPAIREIHTGKTPKTDILSLIQQKLEQHR